jgi:hypothetical protein
LSLQKYHNKLFFGSKLLLGFQRLAMMRRFGLSLRSSCGRSLRLPLSISVWSGNAARHQLGGPLPSILAAQIINWAFCGCLGHLPLCSFASMPSFN